jgi:hypothetical protein
MADTTVTKVDSKFSPTGVMGQKYLASGVHVAMRLWEDEPPGKPKAATQREYEIVGYVIKGRAQLEIEGRPSCSSQATHGSCPKEHCTAILFSSRSRRSRQPTLRLRCTGATRLEQMTSSSGLYERWRGSPLSSAEQPGHISRPIEAARRILAAIHHMIFRLARVSSSATGSEPRDDRVTSYRRLWRRQRSGQRLEDYSRPGARGSRRG